MILAGKWVSDRPAGGVIAYVLILLIRVAMNVPVMAFKVCWSLEGSFTGSGKHAWKFSVFALCIISTMAISIYQPGPNTKEFT
jgi:hypothetical protein